MTGRPVSGAGDAIWDDGEWISWDYINSQLDTQGYYAEDDDQEDDPRFDLLNDLLSTAREYFNRTGRHLQIFGEIGELYGEVKYGIKRHAPNAQGSDGKIGNDFIEIKTISPEKKKKKIHVKRSGNFGKLLIVRISADYQIESRLVDRSLITGGRTGKASLSWSSIQNENGG